MKNSKSTIRQFFVPLSLGAVFGMVLGFSPIAEATLITWQTPVAVNISDATQVVTTGALVLASDANNLGNDNGNNSARFTINGVTFSPTFGIYLANASGGVAGGVYGPNTTPYSQMLSSGAYRSSAGTATITIPSLIIGRPYEVQIFTPFWDANYQSKFSDGANSVNMGNTLAAPTFVIGTFIADATTKTISFDAAAGSSFGLLSAFEVRDLIPEPSTFALLGFGGLFVWRRLRQSRVLAS